MRMEYLKTLWLLRFEKLRVNENKAAWGYEEILEECLEAFGAEEPVVQILRRLVKEERVHHQMAEELIKICQRTRPELDA